MKFLSLAAVAFLSLGFRAHAAQPAVSNDTSQVPQELMQGAEPGDLITRTSEDGSKFEVLDENGQWVSAAIQQTSEDTATVTGANGDKGQLITTNFDEQNAQDGKMQLAAYRIWHRGGWGHFGWHRRWWHPGRHVWRGGWHWRRWHRGWRRW